MNLQRTFNRFGCDRGSRHNYHIVYAPILAPVRYDNLNILEIGIFHGAGMCVWLDYLPNCHVVGIDTFQRVDPDPVVVLHDHKRVDWYKTDSAVWETDDKFDFIFDDGDHSASTQLKTFKNLYPSLKKGGTYFIEDVFPVDIMSAAEIRQHGKWVSPLADYLALLAGLPNYKMHNLRAHSAPDSCILEITK